MENLGLNIPVLRATATQWHQEALQQAVTRRLLHSTQTGLPYRRYRQPRQLVHQLGHTFVRLGQWLERRAAQTTSF